MEFYVDPKDYEVKGTKKDSFIGFKKFFAKIDHFAYQYGSFHLIVGICIALQIGLDLFLLQGGLPSRLQWGALISPLFPIEFFRFINAIFLHGGWIHLLVNMLSLYYLSRQTLEKIWDAPKTFLVFFISGLLTNIACFILRMTQASPSISVGASGGIFGLIGALLAYFIFNKSLSSGTKKYYIQQIFSILAFNLIIGLMIPNIDILGHALGFVFGFILGFIVERLPYSFYKQRKSLWGFLWFLSIVVILVSFIMATISYWQGILH